MEDKKRFADSGRTGRKPGRDWCLATFGGFCKYPVGRRTMDETDERRPGSIVVREKCRRGLQKPR